MDPKLTMLFLLIGTIISLSHHGRENVTQSQHSLDNAAIRATDGKGISAVRLNHRVRRGIRHFCHFLEIWLFTHTPCPSRVVTKILAQQNRDQTIARSLPRKRKAIQRSEHQL
jgi:hypothetical protein